MTPGGIEAKRALLLVAAIALSLHSGCSRGMESVHKESKIVMGTVVEITAAHRSEETARAAIREAMAELQRVDDLLSTYKEGSVARRINAGAAAAKIAVDEDTFRLLRDAVALSAASGGAFDVTIWPVSRLWDFDHGGKVPLPGEIENALPSVGYQKLVLDDGGMSVGFSAPGVGVDLGAIAKGWAVDRAIEKIVARGVGNAIVDAGGDLRIIGRRPGKDFWRIGIQHPREPGTLLATLELKDTAVVTSGDYERYFTAEGVRYHHILDPATGRPARGCQSVTVLAPTAAEADACATAAFVLGPSKGLDFLRSRPGVRGLIVDAAGELHWTDAEFARTASR